MSLEGINVCIRVRPFIQREIDANETNGDDWLVNGDSNYIQSTIPGKKQMNFDRVFDNYATNGMIYDEAAKRIIDSAFEGVNGTILAYGQTSSGKTFTMSSVMREAFSNIFNRVRNDKTRSYEVSASYCEVYNEVITDLADVTKTGLAVAQDTGLVRDLTIRPMGSEQDILRFHEDGTKNRKVGATKMNAESSRSHSIFQLFVKSYPIDAPKSSLPQGVARTKVNTAGTLEATINFVDLAGSERASQTEAKGDRLQEGAQINKSLLVLGKVIRTLASRKAEQPPYRESKLTQLLRRSLGGNCRTTMICCVTMAKSNVLETTSTLSFAVNAKNVVNTVGVNETLDDKQMLARAQEKYATLRMKFLQFVEVLKSQGITLPQDFDNFVTTLAAQKGLTGTLPKSAPVNATNISNTAQLEDQLGALGAELSSIGEVTPIIKKQRSNNIDPITGLVQLQSPNPFILSTPIDTAMQTEVSVLGELLSAKCTGKDGAMAVSGAKKRKSIDQSEDDDNTMTSTTSKVIVYNDPIEVMPNTAKVMEYLGYTNTDASLADFFDQNFTALEEDLTNMLVSNGLFVDTRELHTTIDTQKEEILTLKQQTEELHTKFTTMMTELQSTIDSQRMQAERDVLALKDEIEGYKAQLNGLETSTSTHQFELQSALTQYQIEKNARDQEIKQLHEQMETMGAQHLENLTSMTQQFQQKEKANIKEIEALGLELDRIAGEFQQYKEDTELLLEEGESDGKKALQMLEAEKDEELAELRRLNDKLRSDHQAEYSAQVAKFETVRNNLLDELQDVEEHNFREYALLEQKHKELDTQYAAQIAQLNKTIEQLNGKQIEFETKIQLLASENDTKLQLINDLRTQKEKEMAFISDRVKSVTGDKDKVITTMENELNTLRQYQSSQQQLYEGLQAQYKHLEVETSQYKRESSEYRIQLSTKDHELQRIRQRAEEVSKKQKEDSENLVKKFKEKIQKLNLDNETEIEKKENEILRLKELQQTFATKVKKSISDAKGERDEALTMVETLNKEKRRVEHETDTIKIRYNELQKSLVLIKQDLAKQRETTHSLESAVSEESNLKKFHIQENLILKKQLQQVEQRYNEHLTTMQHKFERDLVDRNRMIQQLEGSQQQKVNEIEYYKQANQETVNKLGQAMAEVQTLKMQLQQHQAMSSVSMTPVYNTSLSTMPTSTRIKKQQIYQDNDDDDEEHTQTLQGRPFAPVSSSSYSSNIGQGLSSSPYKRLDITKPASTTTRSKPEVVKFVGGRTTRAATRRAMNDENH